jgi:hypothetical protein
MAPRKSASKTRARNEPVSGWPADETERLSGCLGRLLRHVRRDDFAITGGVAIQCGLAALGCSSWRTSIADLDRRRCDTSRNPMFPLAPKDQIFDLLGWPREAWAAARSDAQIEFGRDAVLRVHLNFHTLPTRSSASVPRIQGRFQKLPSDKRNRASPFSLKLRIRPVSPSGVGANRPTEVL